MVPGTRRSFWTFSFVLFCLVLFFVFCFLFFVFFIEPLFSFFYERVLVPGMYERVCFVFLKVCFSQVFYCFLVL